MSDGVMPPLPDGPEELVDQLKLLREESKRELAAASAIGVQVNPLALVSLQMKVLLQTLLSPQGQLEFHIAFEKQLIEQLQGAQVRVRASVLQQDLNGPLPPPPGS